jgi:hypothetical protein
MAGACPRLFCAGMLGFGEDLSTHYNLAENPDILLSRAEALYTQCRFAEALELGEEYLDRRVV